MQVQVTKQPGRFSLTVTTPRQFDILSHIELADDTGFAISGVMGIATSRTTFVTEDEAKLDTLLAAIGKVRLH